MMLIKDSQYVVYSNDMCFFPSMSYECNTTVIQ